MDLDRLAHPALFEPRRKLAQPMKDRRVHCDGLGVLEAKSASVARSVAGASDKCMTARGPLSGASDNPNAAFQQVGGPLAESRSPRMLSGLHQSVSGAKPTLRTRLYLREGANWTRSKRNPKRFGFSVPNLNSWDRSSVPRQLPRRRRANELAWRTR